MKHENLNAVFELTGEFMLDEDLWLHDCNAVGFFNHHHRTCKKDGATCSDMGHDGFEEGAKLISRLLARRVLEAKSPLWKLFLRSGEMSQHTEEAWKHIVLSFAKVRTRGRLKYDDPPAQAIVGAMLERFAAGRSIKELGSLFRSKAELELTLRNLAARKLGIRLNRIPAKHELV
ncbi:MAG TPA: hypothetical protein VMU05_01720 [Dongiaceae bacterium]|nr:hypothetical protein [Dongiaceae bacterium]